MTEGQEKSTPREQTIARLSERWNNDDSVMAWELLGEAYDAALRSVAGGEPPQELQTIDAIFARRPAFADCDTRAEKVEKAVESAAMMDMLLRKHGAHGANCMGNPCTCGWAAVLEWLRGNAKLVAGGEPEQWISVRERMPEEWMPVWVHGGVAIWDCPNWRTLMETNRPIIQWPVTHWMPLSALPAPPQEKEQK